MDIGKKLKKIRKSKGLTGQDIAILAGISQSTISDIEKDKRSVTLNTLEKICEALGISVVEFLDDEYQQKELSDDEKIILKIYSSLTEKEKYLLVQLLKSILDRLKE